MYRHIVSVLCATLLLVGGGFAATKLLENIPLVWKPTETLGSLGPLNLGGAGDLDRFARRYLGRYAQQSLVDRGEWKIPKSRFPLPPRAMRQRSSLSR